jgi:hypothetical protein
MAALAPAEVEIGQDIDLNASPAGSIDTNITTNTTPDTEFSPPESPIQRSGPPKNARTLAKTKLASLTQEEKVCYTEAPFEMMGVLTSSRCLYWPPQTSGERRRFRLRTSRRSRQATDQTVLVAVSSSGARR